MTRKRTRKKGFTLPVRKLERLAEEATINAYSESEQATGFLTMIDEHVELPFETEILGHLGDEPLPGQQPQVHRHACADEQHDVALRNRGDQIIHDRLRRMRCRGIDA